MGSSLLAIGNGGTGWAELQANTLLLGNGTNRLATTSAGTNGQTLALVSGVPTWVATTTFSSGLTYSGGNVTNTGVLSNVAGDGIAVDAATGNVTISQTNKYRIATSSDIVASQLAYFTQTGGLTTLGSVATGTVSSANSALTVTSNRAVLGGSLTLTVATTSNNIFTGSAGQVLAFINGGWVGVATTTLASISGQLDLATQVTGDLPFANLTQIAANSILGNISGATGDVAAIATSSLYTGTNGQVLARVNGTWVGVATTTYSGGLTYSGGTVTSDLGTSISVGELASADFGDWTCNGSTCSLDADTVSDSELDYASVTLADFTNDAGFITTAGANTFTGLQNFSRASSTQFSAGLAYFGATATSTFDGAGNLSLAGLANAGLGVNALGQVYAAATSTLSTIAGTLNLATQVGSSLLAIGNGGTGWAELQANTLLLGNGTNRLATTSAGTNGQTLALVSGVPTWVATTTFSGGLTYSAGNVTLSAIAANSVLANGTGGSAAPTAIATSTLFGATGTGGTVLGFSNGVWQPMATATCIQITGSADLCDGNDATGGGGSAYEVATTSDIAVSQLAYFTKTGGLTTLGSVATGTVSSANSALSVTAGRSVLGGALTLTIATTSNNMFSGSAGQVLAFINGGWVGVATTTAGTGLTYTGSAFNVNTSQNIATLSNLTSDGVIYTSGGTGALNVDTSGLDVARGGTGAVSLTGLLQGNGTGAFTAISDSSTAGQVLRVTGASTYAWGALDLADSDAITGDLPFANLTQVAANSVLGNISGATGDVAAVATSSLFTGSNGQVLARSGNTWVGVATTTAGTGLSYSGTSFTVNTSQNISTLSNLTSNGFVKTSGGTGALSVDTNTYLTAAANTFTGLQQFSAAASTTQLSVYANAYFGATATTTIGSTGTVTLASGASYTGAGAVTLSSGGSSGLTLDSASGRVSVATGDFLSVVVSGVSGAAAGDIWYDSAAGKYKINEGGTTKTLCNTTDLGCGGGGGGSPGGSGTELQYRIDGSNFGAVTSSAFNTSLGALGIGTTTPRWTLQLASSTRAQLALSDGSLTSSHWAFRNAGGNLYLATSSPSTFATTSIAALEIAGGGFGTTTVRGLNINAQATTTSNVGFNITSGCYAVNGTCVGGGGGGIDGVTVTTFVVGGGTTWTKSNYTGLKFTQVITTAGGGAGGGAGGAASDTASEHNGGGGGAGGTAIEMIAEASLGSTETVTVGAKGTGVAAAAGNNGSASSFGSHNSASPGTGGRAPTVNGNACTVGDGSGWPGFGGGATGGDVNLTGGDGGVGDCIADNARGGIGGASYWGGGGAGATTTATNAGVNGQAAAAYGSGGGGGAESDSGSATAATGGAGADGIVVTMNYTASSGDLAEWYETKEGVEAGDIVAISRDFLEYDSRLGLQKTSVLGKAVSGDAVVGVISTSPWQTIGGDILNNATRPRPVALAGRVPVKFSEENGPVVAGDLLAVSSVPGVAMRSTKAGAVIGRALEDSACVPGETCTVLVMVHTGYSTGALLGVAYRNEGMPLDTIDGDGHLASSIIRDVGRALLVEMLQQKRAITASSTLSEVFTDRVAAALEIISPRVIADTLVVNAIEPVERGITIRIVEGGGLVIERVLGEELSMTFGDSASATPQTLVHIDDLGNALFAGALSAANLEVGSPQAPGGITLYDTETGEPYCTKVTRGTLVTSPGRCALGALNPLLQPHGGSQDGEGIVAGDTTMSPGSPVITIQGNNPAVILVGSSYADLGALVTDDTDQNLGIHVYQWIAESGQWEEVQTVQIDTSIAGEHTIMYRATDTDGNIGEATRTVIVQAPADPETESKEAAPTPHAESVAIPEEETTVPPDEAFGESGDETLAE